MNIPEEYNGSGKYIFFSYCHSDAPRVMPIIAAMNKLGYRIWFDRGIQPGTDWPDVIAEHLEKSSVFIACISEASLRSHNCRNELNYAILKGKQFIGVILEPVRLTPGMEMQMATYQAIYCQNYSSFGEFFAKLTSAPCLAECREEQQTAAAPVRDPRVKAAAPQPVRTPQQKAAAPVRNPQAKAAAPQAYNELATLITNVKNSAFTYSLLRNRTGEAIEIDRSEFTIGRKREMCSYAITDNPAISRVHGIFRVTAKGLFVSDNNSLNRTSVNGRTLQKGGSAALKNGDVVSFADESFTVQIFEKMSERA